MADAQILAANDSGAYLLRLCGDVRLTLSTTLDDYLDGMVADPEFQTLIVDLCEAENLDSTTLGMLAKVALRVEADFHVQPDLYSCKAGISRLIRSMGFSQLFHIHEELCCAEGETSELAAQNSDEKQMHAKVLDAHRTLMSLSTENEARFKDLLNALESVQ